jgi:hypothetical protein
MYAKASLTRVALVTFLLLCAGAVTASAADAPNPFVGEWALTIGKSSAGWLGVKDDGGKPTASLLWIAGSVEKVPEAKIEGDTLVLTLGRPNSRNANANPETVTVKVEGDTLKGERGRKRADGTATKQEFTGKRQPPVPPAPDLSKVKYGEPVQLFNGKDLSGWRIIEPGAANGWSVKDGALLSNPVQEPGQPHKNYGNLRTDREFEDFNLTLECNVAKDGNSGIYLRGIYEVQVADTFGKPLDPHNMGAVYSRIKPTESAEKQAGEWQTFDITLVDRHVTVILNGKKIIDNQPVLGCTGGALWSDPLRPGPIYLQGDHSVASFRNIVLKPVVK